MRQIDLDSRKHSHLYELRPMSRWWVVFAALLVLGAASINGFFDAATWALVMVGGFFVGAVFLAFPRYWLSRRD